MTTGATVYEPTGGGPTPAMKARDFIKNALTCAQLEYTGGHALSRLICLEEAHGVVPEWHFASKGDQDASAVSASYVMQARESGISFLVVSQRTAVVSKSVLSQCESYVVLRTIDDTSLSYFETLVGPAARQLLPGLKRHEALCFGSGINSDGPVVVTLDSPAPLATARPSSQATATVATDRSEDLAAASEFGDVAPF